MLKFSRIKQAIPISTLSCRVFILPTKVPYILIGPPILKCQANFEKTLPGYELFTNVT
jgi:hypothetical protein